MHKVTSIVLFFFIMFHLTQAAIPNDLTTPPPAPSGGNPANLAERQAHQSTTQVMLNQYQRQILDMYARMHSRSYRQDTCFACCFSLQLNIIIILLISAVIHLKSVSDALSRLEPHNFLLSNQTISAPPSTSSSSAPQQ